MISLRVRQLFISLLFIVAFSAQSQTLKLIESYDENIYRHHIEKIILDMSQHELTGADSLVAASSYFLKKPYVLGALGEGKKGQFDRSPLYRTDAFDCETYVDTVLALLVAKNKNIAEFESAINKIRYADSKPSFVTRNHFTQLDWNTHNQRKGYITDITATVFPQEHKVSHTYIDKPNWFRHLSYGSLKYFSQPNNPQQLLQQLRDLSLKTKAAESIVSYVPLSALFTADGKPNMKLFNRIPHGVIIEIVRPNWDLRKLIGTRLDISHLGFGIRYRGQLIFRQASSDAMQVIDVPLVDYLKKYLHHATIKGIHIEKINLISNPD